MIISIIVRIIIILNDILIWITSLVLLIILFTSKIIATIGSKIIAIIACKIIITTDIIVAIIIFMSLSDFSCSLN